MRKGRRKRTAGEARWLAVVAVLAAIVAAVPFTFGAAAPGPAVAPTADAGGLSVTCLPFGLYGDITMPPMIDRLSDGSDNLTFVGTSNGLYVVDPGGSLRHFLYSPFGVRHVALVEDVTGDGIREVAVALGDTQVPALRCYDGATWQEIWRYAPMARVWDGLWVDCQVPVTGLAVAGQGGLQGLVVTAGRWVISIQADDGTERWRYTDRSPLWRMVTLEDLNGDDADEVLVGSDGGHLVWLDAETGGVEWQTSLPRHRGVSYGAVAHMVTDMAVLDEGAGKVAVASGDGSVQLFDLPAKRREWDTLVFTGRYPGDPRTCNYLVMSPTADITGDGLGELLLSTPMLDQQIEFLYDGTITFGDKALCDSTGRVLWDAASLSGSSMLWPGMPPETGLFEGRPVYLQIMDSAEGHLALSLVDLEDGQSVRHRVPLDALPVVGIVVQQPGGNGYLSFSSDCDLLALSAAGERLWCYPRIAGIEAVGGSFVGDDAGDVLFQCQSAANPYSVSGPAVGLLKMMDGATGDMAWTYEVPYAELSSGGGLRSVQVVDDLVGGDGVRDFMGCLGDSVLIFSGRDGITSVLPVGQPVSSVEIISNGTGGRAIAVTASGPAGAAAGGTLSVLDLAGQLLWSTTTTDWLGGESGAFIALDDINSDNVSDLAVFSGSRIVVLKSRGQAAGYEPHQVILPDDEFSVLTPESVADTDGDGIRELAYLQESAPIDGSEGPWVPQRQVLCFHSPEDGRLLYKADLDGEALARDLCCGDFDGDACPDSILAVETAGTDWTSTGVLVISGKDGSRLQALPCGSGLVYLAGTYSGNNRLPVVNIGDVNGDGADDLARDAAMEESHFFSVFRRQQMEVLDVSHGTTLKTIPVAARLESSSFGLTYTVPDGAMLANDFDADGQVEVIMMVLEPSLPAYNPDASTDRYSVSGSLPPYMALVDVDSGRRLCAFTGFRADAISVLQIQRQQPGTLALAACGGLCYLRTDAGVQVTAPENEATTRPSVGLSWEGPSGGGLSQVFVDGVRNAITGDSGSGLYLGPGDHEIVVRSIDDCGRIMYGPSDLGAPLVITVTPSPWKPAWLVLALFALLAAGLALAWPRLQRARRARRRS